MWRLKTPLPVKGALLYILVMMLMTLSLTVVAPIIPLFMKQFVSKDAFVGYIFSLNAVILIIATLVMDVLLRYISKIRFLKWTLFGYAISFLFFPLVQNVVQLLVLSFVRMFVATAASITLGLLIRDSVKKSGIGRTEGFFFTFLNLAWLVGPIIGGPFAGEFGFGWAFVFASVFSFIAWFVVVVKNPFELYIPQNDHDHLVENVKDYFRSWNLTALYLVSMGLAFFWTIVYTYLPLFLGNAGWSSARIGYAIAAFVIPLILLEVVVGRWVDHRGVKQFFILGFVILGVFTGLSYLAASPFVLVALLICAVVGAAFIEPVREAFLFKTIKIRDEVRFYTIYATAFSVGSMLGPLVFSSILLVSDFKTMFLAGGLFLLAFAVLAFTIREHHAYVKDFHHRAPGAADVPLVPDRV